MTVDYIRRDINEEISEDGGAYIQLVNKSTVGLDSSIKEAKENLFVVGDESLIKSYFVGVMRAVFEGIAADGHPRTVGDITFYPTCTGVFDLDTGWNSLINGVTIHARLLNGITLDVSDWSFNDVTPGRQNFSLTSVSNGTVDGVVSPDKDANLNGKNFPDHDDLTVAWECNGKSGTVDAAKFTANVTRITVDKSALSTLTSADNGKVITFTVKGCYVKKQISGVFAYVAPEPSLTLLKQGERADNTFKFDSGIVNVSHENYTHAEGDVIVLRIYKNGALYYTYDITDQVGTWGADAISFPTIENNSAKSDNEFIVNDNDIALVRGTSVYPLTVSVVAS